MMCCSRSKCVYFTYVKEDIKKKNHLLLPSRRDFLNTLPYECLSVDYFTSHYIFVVVERRRHKNPRPRLVSK